MDGMQLEDLNHAMLRGVYFLSLIIYASVFFVVGLLLLPVAYLAELLSVLNSVRSPGSSSYLLANSKRNRQSLIEVIK